MLLPDWANDAPTATYYNYPPSLTPHPFMGLGQLVAARIHQMRAAKSYPAAHPSWFEENPQLTCPPCEIEPETFRHAILTCPARARGRDLYLKEISSLGHNAPIWTEPHLLLTLSKYITNTRTGFPPEMIPEPYAVFSPPLQN